MKLKYIILLLLSVAISSYASDSLKVNAILYRLNTATNLDKIIVINNETGVTFETKGTSIKKNLLTEIKEDENLTFYANIQKLNDKDFVIRFPNSKNKVNVKIYDYKGSLVFENDTYSGFNFNLLHDGIYFIVANDDNEIIKKSINTYAYDITTISNVYPILKPNTNYTFIGIKNGFRPDTLAKIDITLSDTLNFIIKDTSKYNFRSGSLVIKGLNVKSIVNDKDNNIIKKDIFFNLSNNLTYYDQKYGYRSNCMDEQSSDNLLTFCFSTYNLSVESTRTLYNNSNTKVSLFIDNDIITKISFSYYKYDRWSTSGSAKSDDEISQKGTFSVLNVPLLKISTFDLKMDNNIVFNFYEVKTSHFGINDTYYSISESNYPSSDSVTVTLTLNP